MVARDRRSTYLIAALEPLDDQAQEDAGKRLLAAFADDPRVTLGGNPVANHEISKTIEDDLREPKSCCAADRPHLLLPLPRLRRRPARPVAGVVTVLVSFFLLRALASVTSLSIYALNLVTGLSIGLSIDWSLLLLARYREERASTRATYSSHCVAPHPGRTDDLLQRGHRRRGARDADRLPAALSALDGIRRDHRLCSCRSPQPFFFLPSSACSADRAVTLPRWLIPGDSPSRGRSRMRSARLDVRRPLPIVAVVVVLMIAIASPALGVRWTTVGASSLPASTQAYRADALINRSRAFPANSGSLHRSRGAAGGRFPQFAPSPNVRGSNRASAMSLSHDEAQERRLADRPGLGRRAVQRGGAGDRAGASDGRSALPGVRGR